MVIDTENYELIIHIKYVCEEHFDRPFRVKTLGKWYQLYYYGMPSIKEHETMHTYALGAYDMYKRLKKED